MSEDMGVSQSGDSTRDVPGEKRAQVHDLIHAKKKSRIRRHGG